MRNTSRSLLFRTLRTREKRYIAALVTLIGVVILSVGSTAQTTLANTARIPEKSISIRYPDGWSVGQPSQNSWVLLNVPTEKLETTEANVRITIGYLERPDHADAVAQLTEYAKESPVNSTFLVIGGWPALQRVQLVKRRLPGERQKGTFKDKNMVQVTTAVAAGSLLVRAEGNLPSDASQQLKDLVLAIGRSMTFATTGDPVTVQRDLIQLNKTPRRPDAEQSVEPKSEYQLPEEMREANAGTPIGSLIQLPNGSNGELEVAVSNNGSNIVVVKQSGFVTSNDGGRTFPFSGSLNVSDGDSSIAFGQSGNFYHSALACFGNSCQPPCPGASPSGTPPSTSNCVEVAPSTNNGQSFNALVNAAVCPNTGSGACFLDQEHIAADRTNGGAGGTDRVYAAVRNCQGGCGTNGAFVSCSPDSGATWSPLFTMEVGSDFPRVAVGSDGALYVVYELGGNIRMDKFNACTTSATQITRTAGFPVTVSAFGNFAGCEVMNGFGGLDRCNDGNTLSGPTVSVDDTNANHVYVSWANNTAANNENIVVADSTNGGVNWRPSVTINGGGSARRFHAWVCASGGNAFVNWYDRRAATAANNDLTDYFAASAGLSGGNLVANNDEFKLSTSSDAQCSLWPRGVRSTWDSENCSVQPELAGFCKLTPIPNPDTSSNTRCDFTSTTCPFNPAGMETCQLGNFGQAVKYGDYNGNACVLGRLYSVFASSAGISNVANFFQSFVVGSTPTTTSYSGDTSGIFHHNATLSAVLTLSGTTTGINGQTISFTLGTQSCSSTTNANGFASCILNLNQAAGPYTVTAKFAGSGNYRASSAATGFTISKDPTTLTYTGDVELADGAKAKLKGVLREDLGAPIAGRLITFTLGSGATAQSCTGTTNALGVATCTIAVVAQPRGNGTVSAVFAGDAFYLPSSASANTTVTGFPDATRLTPKPNPSNVGQAVRLVAVVVASPGLPKPPLPSTATGTVTFFDLQTPLGTVALDGTATATLNVTFSSTGKHRITAQYSGDTIFVPSMVTVTQTVQ